MPTKMRCNQKNEVLEYAECGRYISMNREKNFLKFLPEKLKIKYCPLL